MVDVTKPIVNPRLSEALAALHRENTPANQDRALRELMTQAHLLAPVVLTPAPPPAVSGQTTLEQNTAIQFQLISSQEGRPFFPAFTNWGELRKLCGPRDQQTLVLTFDDYASMLQRDSRAAGFVVDPFGDSLTLDRETVARLARQKAEGTPPVRQVIQKDTRVMLGDPAEYPERMVEAICSAARELPAVKALYLRLMVREGEMEPSYSGGSGPGWRAGRCLFRHCRGRPPLAGGKNGGSGPPLLPLWPGRLQGSLPLLRPDLKKQTARRLARGLSFFLKAVSLYIRWISASSRVLMPREARASAAALLSSTRKII